MPFWSWGVIDPFSWPHLRELSTPEVPNLQDLMPDDLRWSQCNNRNKVHNKCNVFESSWNHPPSPGSWKSCLPQNWSLVPKRFGITDLHYFKELSLHLRVPSQKTFLVPVQDRQKKITRMALISVKPGFKHWFSFMHHCIIIVTLHNFFLSLKSFIFVTKKSVCNVTSL